MTLKELEQLAAKGAPIPDGLTIAQECVFLELRALYGAYRSKLVPKAQAKQEKGLILHRYEDLALKERAMNKHMGMLRMVQRYEMEIQHSGCNACKKLYRALCGLEREENYEYIENSNGDYEENAQRQKNAIPKSG